MMPHGPVFDTFLQVRLTTHDKERIKARAIEAGMQTSEYVRKRALGEKTAAQTSRERFGPPEDYRTPGLGIHKLSVREAQASVVLDGETMYEGHPMQRKLEEEQLERNIRGSVGMQAPRNEP